MTISSAVRALCTKYKRNPLEGRPLCRLVHLDDLVGRQGAVHEVQVVNHPLEEVSVARRAGIVTPNGGKQSRQRPATRGPLLNHHSILVKVAVARVRHDAPVRPLAELHVIGKLLLACRAPRRSEGHRLRVARAAVVPEPVT